MRRRVRRSTRSPGATLGSLCSATTVTGKSFWVILKGVVALYRWRLHAFCLMTNHVHLVIQTPEPNLGDGMQRLLGTYGKFFNWRYERPGHVFTRPFKSERIKDERQLVAAVEYCAENPVRAGLCDSTTDWRWSSHGA